MKNVNLNRRLFVSMFICLLLIVPMVSCKSYAEYDGGDNYEYSDYEFNNEEAQFYMAENTAAAENGYYYIACTPVYGENHRFMYFYDMKNQTSLPLCSKLNCEHDGEDCDAYIYKDLEENECLGNSIWYYKERIYMIERTKERDLLVSYDKNGRDKKIRATLSVDGYSVKNGAKASGGKLYYYTPTGDSYMVYSVSFTENEKPQLIKIYEKNYKYLAELDLYAVNSGIYMRFFGSDGMDKEEYIYDYYDIGKDNVINCFDSNKDNLAFRGKVEHHSGEQVFYESGCAYFPSVDGDEFIVNRLNFDTKKCDEMYVIDTSKNNNSTSLVKVKGYDGKYMYIYEPAAPEMWKKYEVDGNNLYIVNMNGELIDKLKFEWNEKFARENGINDGETIDMRTFCCGDDRYILAVINRGDLKGLELNDKWLEKYRVAYKNMVSTRRGGVYANVVGVIDKKQIGTGSFNWINVTSK